MLMGQPVMVKMSEAEKNLAWEAAEAAKRQQKQLEAQHGPEVAAAMMAAAAGVTSVAAAALPPALPGMPPMPGMAPAAAAVTVAAGPARLALSNLPTSITGAAAVHAAQGRPAEREMRALRGAQWAPGPQGSVRGLAPQRCDGGSPLACCPGRQLSRVASNLLSVPPPPAEVDVRPIFEPFGQLDFVMLQRDAANQPTGNGFVQ